MRAGATVARIDWPGNVSSLEAVVTQVLGHVSTEYVGVRDLPSQLVVSASRRQLSGLERVEANAILQAVQDARGNKHAAAEMLVDVEASRSAVMHAAWSVAAGEPEAALQGSIAKTVACAAAVRVADKALFLHGAVGYTWEHDLQLLFKRIKSDALLFGSPDAHRDLIAAHLGLVRHAQPVT